MSDHDREWGVPPSPRVIASNPIAREERLREAMREAMAHMGTSSLSYKILADAFADE